MNRKGQALVEFVLILPIFIMILFSIVDFGMIFNKKNELENISIDIINLLNNNNKIEEIQKEYPKVDIKLTNEEKYSIRWHMGFTEPKELYGTLGEAYKKYPAALLLHEADLESTYFYNI